MSLWNESASEYELGLISLSLGRISVGISSLFKEEEENNYRGVRSPRDKGGVWEELHRFLCCLGCNEAEKSSQRSSS